MKLKHQKYIIILFLFIINLLLSSTFIIYSDKWYAFLFILSLASIVNSFSVFLIAGHKIITNEKETNRIQSRNYIYVIPCYNESEKELKDSINSLTLQRVVKNDNRSLFIICDGIVTGKGNTTSTDKILLSILKININELGEYYDYKTWDNNRNVIRIYTGRYSYLNESIDFILIIKNKNYGKRDSLVLTRKLCYNYNSYNINNNNTVAIQDSLINYIFTLLKPIYDTNIDYIIGIDGDTIFDYNCSYELIQCIDKDENIHGCVGYVDILPFSTSRYSPFILYQYGEYMFSQCLRRYTQSKITKKVNCLSGCNQILRISKETCGAAILNVLNYLPEEDESIFNHIRSYASEDRNHITHMLSMYPYVKSTQALKAIAYTNVPTSIDVFISQRRRWNLGAMSNDMMLVSLPDINIFERISAFVNVFTYCLSPFIFISTVCFIRAIITFPTPLMLYLSTLIFIPLVYAFFIPIFIRPLSFTDSLYFYASYLLYLLVGSFTKVITFGYSLMHMDNLTWGKTRETEEVKEYITVYNNNKNIYEIPEMTNSIDINNNNNNYMVVDNNDFTSISL